tara:strand:- start:797 stop:2401 length:1605 start_codon:yes stop_codon:yes gene_type:complete
MPCSNFKTALLILAFLIIFISLGFIAYNCYSHETFQDEDKTILTEPQTKDLFYGLLAITPKQAISDYNNKLEADKSLAADNSMFSSDLTNLSMLTEVDDRNPIVFVPALGASRLEYTTDDSYIPPHKLICSSSGNLWATVDASVPYFEDCFLDRFAVHLDSDKRIVNTRGVYVNATTGENGSEEGSFKAESYLLYMLGIGIGASVYMENFYKSLTDLGYVDKKDLFSFGYDFRRIGDGYYTGKYFSYLSSKIEEIYNKTNKQIILLSHSLGCPTTIYFLNIMGEKWNKKYIRNFIAFAPAWGGSIKTMKPILYGDNEGIPLTKNADFNKAEQVMGGIMMCMPNSLIYKDDKIVVIEDKQGNKTEYTSKELSDLFKISGHDDSSVLYNIFKNDGVIDTVSGNKPFTLDDPGIKVDVIYSNCVKTASQYTFKSSPDPDPFKNAPVITKNIAGDGTVPEKSCSFPCDKWNSCGCTAFPRKEDVEKWKSDNNFTNVDDNNPTPAYISALTKFHSTFEHLPIIQNEDVINYAVNNFVKN